MPRALAGRPGLLLLFLLGGCPSSSSPSAPTDAGADAPGASALPLQAGAAVLLTDLNGLHPHVFDAVSAGTGFAALVRVGDPGLPVEPGRPSTDWVITTTDAATWVANRLPDGLAPAAILAAGDRLFLLQAGGGVYQLAPGTFQATPVATGASPTMVAGTVAAAGRIDGTVATLWRFDAATGAAETATATVASGCNGPLSTLDGTTFETVCYLIDRRCWVTARFGEAAAVTTCVGYEAWPIPAQATQQLLPVGGQLQLAWEDGGQVQARRIAEIGPTAVVTLGPGDLERDLAQELFLRPGWGGLVALRDPLAMSAPLHRRFVDATGAPHGVVVAPSPCTDDAACPDLMAYGNDPDQRLVRLLPLGADRYLAFYVLYQPPPAWASPSSHTWFVVARIATNGEVATPAFNSDGIVSSRDHLIPYVPAPTPLEAMCARALACFPEVQTMTDCVAALSVVTGADPATDPTFQRFLATPTGDCAAFRATFPALALAKEPQGPATCLGSWAINSLYQTYYDCAAVGEPCTVNATWAGCGDLTTAACGCDASGHAVVCTNGQPLTVSDCAALGQTCQSSSWGGSCTTGVCGGTQSQCDRTSGILTRCENSIARTRIACGRAALGCEGTGAQSSCAVGGPQTTCTPGQADTCNGPYVVYCLGGEQRFIDCPALGYAGCTSTQPQTTAFARCTP